MASINAWHDGLGTCRQASIHGTQCTLVSAHAQARCASHIGTTQRMNCTLLCAFHARTSATVSIMSGCSNMLLCGMHKPQIEALTSEESRWLPYVCIIYIVDVLLALTGSLVLPYGRVPHGHEITLAMLDLLA